jgi:hypothetical protein
MANAPVQGSMQPRGCRNAFQDQKARSWAAEPTSDRRDDSFFLAWRCQQIEVVRAQGPGTHHAIAGNPEPLFRLEGKPPDKPIILDSKHETRPRAGRAREPPGTHER